MNIFQDAKGNYSSKRTLGIIYMLGAFIMALIDQITKFEINSFEVWITVVATGASLLGLSLFDGKGKIPKLNAHTSGGPNPKHEEH